MGYTTHLHLYKPVDEEEGYGNAVNGNFDTIDTAIYDLQQSTNPNAYVPTGCQIIGPSITAPTGWLLCDGSEVSRTTYAALFAAIGTTYGTPSDPTKFKLPNKVGRVVVGADPTNANQDYVKGATGGQASVTLTTNQMPTHNHSASSTNAGSHTHTIVIAENGSHAHSVHALKSTATAGGGSAEYGATSWYEYTNTGSAGSHAHTVTVDDGGTTGSHNHDITINNTGSGQAHENRMPYIAEFWWIKT